MRLLFLLFFWGFQSLLGQIATSFTPDKSNPKFEQGSWIGELSAGGMNLALNLLITKHPVSTPELQYQTKLGVPMQGVKNYPASSVTVKKNKITITFDGIGAEFQGQLKYEKIEGVWTQNNTAFPLTLTYGKAPELKRPQTPKAPFNYVSRTVTFSNQNGTVRFEGTLTYPKSDSLKNFPTAVLYTGSGLQDRDESFVGHKPFAVIAHHLTLNGFAVLRVDDRCAGRSICAPGSDKFTTQDLIQDDGYSYAKWALDSICGSQQPLFLIGHSEGGALAAGVNLKLKSMGVTQKIYSVGLAPPLVSGFEINAYQNRLVFGKIVTDSLVLNDLEYMHRGIISSMLDQGVFENFDSLKVVEIIETELNLVSKKSRGIANKNFKKNAGITLKASLIKSYTNPKLASAWFKEFLKFNPGELWFELNEGLILQGSKDRQVPAFLNNRALGKHAESLVNVDRPTSLTYTEFQGLNHLFQPCKTGNVEEYAQIETTIDELVLTELTQWMKMVERSSK